jgi:biopolymer transport protein ExbB/TolQ
MATIWSADQVNRALLLNRHDLFLRWLTFIGVVAFVFLVAWHQGFLGQLYGRDRSYISILITLLFAGFSVHCAVRTFQLSRQLYDAARISQILRNNPSHRLSLAADRVRVGSGLELPKSWLSDFIAELVHKRDAGQDIAHLAAEEIQLMNAYTHQIKGKHEIGWFVADAMIKLGLLGTVIGFIFMLGSVTNLTTFDASIMQDVLTSMSSGMGVALYTTLTGLVCGMLLALQYHFLERGADDLVALMIKVVEVQISPYLKARKGAAA